MEIEKALQAARDRNQSVLTTIKRDGKPQLSNVLHAVGDDRVIRVSTTADRAKYANLRRNPWAALHVDGENFWSYAVLEGDRAAFMGVVDTDRPSFVRGQRTAWENTRRLPFESLSYTYDDVVEPDSPLSVPSFLVRVTTTYRFKGFDTSPIQVDDGFTFVREHGTWKLGAILLSLSVLYGDDGIRHRVEDSGAKVIVTDRENADRMPGELVEEVIVLDDRQCVAMMTDFIAAKPALWNEDIGVPD